MNLPPTIAILSPIGGGNLSMKDFDITLSASDYPDLALWTDLTVSPSVFGVQLPSIALPIVMMQNGIWSTTGLLPYWPLAREAIGMILQTPFVTSFTLTLTLSAFDFDVGRASTPVSVTIMLMD